MTRLRYALIGDAQSPHLLKWARFLAPRTDLWVASSRGFAPGFDGLVPTWKRLALQAEVDAAGGNIALLRHVPTLARWLRQANVQWIHPHYLTSHGTLAWLAKRLYRVPGRLVGSAWGSDILVTPQRSLLYRALTTRILKACELTTSDSQHMAQAMRRLGAREVMVFPFGLERMPPPSADKEPWLFFANRGLEPIYRPDRVLQAFAAVALVQPTARLVVANDGSLRAPLERWVRDNGLGPRVQFTGRLEAEQQARWYAQAAWYLSLPSSDSVSVSVLEAMAHGCIPILSDLPANLELVTGESIGLVLPEGGVADPHALRLLAQQGGDIAQRNRAWVEQHGLFQPAASVFLNELAKRTPGA